MAKTPILALQLADIEYQTGHRRPKSKKKPLLVLLFKLFLQISSFPLTHSTNLGGPKKS